jgi:nitric oxide dioxygenase
MTEQQLRTINESFSVIVPLGDVAATMFYMRLFEVHPELRPLFTSDMKVQGRKLMATIQAAVASARNPRALEPGLQQLARRHATYGVCRKHFDAVGASLLWMLSEVLGDKFTREVREAWTQLYTELTAVMLPLVPAEAVTRQRARPAPARPTGLRRILAWFSGASGRRPPQRRSP